METEKKHRLQRIEKFLQTMDQGVAIISAGAPLPKELKIDIQFRSHSSFFYFTGMEEPDAIAVFSNVHPKHRYCLFIKEADQKEKVWTGARIGLKEAQELTQADAVYPWEEFAKRLPEYLEGAKNLYYTIGNHKALDEIVLQNYHTLQRRLNYDKKVPQTIQDLEKSVETFRVIKDEKEIAAIRNSIKATQEAFFQAFQETKPGMYEYQIEALVSYIYRKAGGTCSFPSIVASADKSTILHYTNNNCQIQEGCLVLLDSGAEIEHYCADVTRTWPVSGKFTKDQRAVYEAVLAAQKKAISIIKPGVEVPNFHQTALEALIDFLIEEKILTQSKEKIIQEKLYQTYYPHSTGHFIGMDVHDIGPYYCQGKPRIFEAGMVVTVEPGLYFRLDIEGVPERFKGIGVRIEDDILVTENGHEILTKEIPKEARELEKILKQKK
ncbi:MAG: aminopeptidase P N-terminal domain-containing protein [Candidatus Brocadiae bacterium]|nr:aminopeptidase P N-terminal domain-containing protein [Candidatus Brocadiia bacterium]